MAQPDDHDPAHRAAVEPPDPDHRPPVAGASTARAMHRATIASVSTAGTLIVAKTGAWLATDSVSLLSTLVDSLLDAAASLITLLAVRHALQPADREHRFGHGKMEPIASLGQAAFVAGSAVFLVIAAAQRFIEPRPVQAPAIGMAVMAASILATLALVAYQRRVVRRTGSLAIQGDSVHYLGDVLANLAVIAGFVVWQQTGWAWVDPALAVGIAVYLLVSAAGIGRHALDMLMDRELPKAERQEISRIVLAHPSVGGMHDLRTRASGPQRFIQLHLELDRRMPLAEAKAVADEIHHQLQTAFPDADVIIHQDVLAG
ncbi:ferrous-iron efflux pump FieF [Limimonas halophila]|uniref:Protein p34 n=1 Tax=Limimonas halophila TaxID=1082479 RepID=A0A1G7UVQ3_9PROT|nr:cation diffusion facilitator family transporter [Limimonas halophila]SDG51361.1 ferrous-iron efflux pump FieF [Limimonas halophila]